MRLTLRTKTLLSISLTLLTLVVVLYFTLSAILLDGFSNIEQKDARDNVKRVLDALSDESAKLTLLAQDWGAWDDAYHFIEDHNPQFVKANLNDETLVQLKLRLIGFIDTSGQVVFATGIDPLTQKATTLPAGFEAYLAAGSPLLQNPEIESTHSGFLLLPEGPLLIISRPILTSENRGPAKGTLVMARSLDPAAVDALAKRTHFNLQIIPSNAPDLPLDFQSALTALTSQLNLAEGIFIKPLDEETLAAYTILKDYSGKPLLILRVETPRNIYQQGQTSLCYLLGSLLVLGLGFGAMTLLLVERGVLKRLAHLSHGVKAIGAEHNSTRRLLPQQSQDELGELAQSINQMLEALEQSHSKERESEARYRQLVELSPESIALQSEGRLVFINSAGAKLLGATSPDEMVGQEISKIVLAQDAQALEKWLNNSDEHSQFREAQLRRLDGQIIEIEAVASLIKSAGKPATQLIVRDITLRKRAEQLEKDRNQVLEMVATNRPLHHILNQLILMLERQRPESGCAILLEKGQLFEGTKFTLPSELITTINNEVRERHALEISQTQTRAAEPAVYLTNLAPNSDGTNGNTATQLRRCWSVIIASAEAKVLGTLNLFQPILVEPTPADLEILGLVSRLALIAIEQSHLTTQLAYQAQHDALTGLPNRFFLEDWMTQALAQATRRKEKVGLLFLDLDRFKLVNDALGHRLGDILLQEVAQRLKQCIRHSDAVARMGGDEFMVVLTELQTAESAVLVAEKILAALEVPFVIEGHQLHISASIGFSLFPDNGSSTKELLHKADSAMYQAKGQGRNNYQPFTKEANTLAWEYLKIERYLRQALDHHEFKLHYQPQFETESGQLVGVEALLRWEHPELGIVSPAQFIPIAEESGLIISIGNWVLQEACYQNKRWQEAGYGPFKVAVNVSALQLRLDNFVENIAEILNETGLEAQWLELELTESVVMSKAQETSLQLARLRQLGVSITIDDFGTGYSSLSYLQKLPITTIKIDRSFITGLGDDLLILSSNGAIVRAILTMAHSLNLEVVAEGVETQEQLSFLRYLGCDMVQGYLLMKPVSQEEFEKQFEKFHGNPGSAFSNSSISNI